MNSILVQRNAIEQAVAASITAGNQPPLKSMRVDSEFHIGHVQGRIAGISPGRTPTSKRKVEQVSIVVLTECNGSTRNAINVRQTINLLRNAPACVILKDGKIIPARAIVKGRIIEIYPDGPAVKFISLITC